MKEVDTKKVKEQIFELMKNPKTNYQTPHGNIDFRPEFVKMILLEIKSVVCDNFDNVDFAYMGEGRGKSHFAMQKEYVRWYYLKKLKLVDYEWGLEIIYTSLGKLMRDLIKYTDKPFRQFILDEGDELKKINWHQALVKMFFSYLRRGRKFRKFIHINHPNISELPEDLIAYRTHNLYEIEMEYNLETLEYIIGHARLINIPRANITYSFVHDRALKEMYVKNKISHNLSNKFFIEPSEVVCLDIRFNNVFPLDEKLYEAKMAKETKDFFAFGVSKNLTDNQAKILNIIFQYLADNRLISSIFDGMENERQAYYELKKNINKLECKV